MDGFTLDLDNEYVLRRFDKITKSQIDERNYRGLVLKNQMKVLLISDPTIEKCAASLNIQVGSMNDPKDVQGLAHLCEHTLFPGNKYYPEERNFHTYILQNNGSTNASTGLDYTNYFFDLNFENLPEALNRFLQCLLNPKFNDHIIEEEINAVHSEFEENLLNDDWRLEQLDKFSANPQHPYSYFNIGNRVSLEIIPRMKDINLSEELENFYKKWYSANIMSLCVVGRENLDELERMVGKLFAGVENKNVKVPEWREDPFCEEHFQCKWYVVPINKRRQLSISFPIPDMQEYYQSSPTIYLSHLFSHEGKGSLLSVLRAKDWSEDLNCGKSQPCKGFAFFSLEILLTEKGIHCIDEIITLIFQYINMIKNSGPMQWIFSEYVTIQKINFNFMKKYSSISHVCATAHDMQVYPIEEVLSAPYYLTKWEPQLINQVLNNLRPENIRVKIMAHNFENITTDVEPWYKTKFEKQKIPEFVIQQWTFADDNSDFKLPDRNEFIPVEFGLKFQTSVVEKFPKMIYNTSMVRVWYKQDQEFLLPNGIVIFHFDSFLVNLDPENFNNCVMFIRMVQNTMSSLTYSAKLAGLKWEIINDKNGITLYIEGYNQKQMLLLEKILEKMINFEVDKEIFEALKKTFILEVKNIGDELNLNAISNLEILLKENLWNKNDLLDASDCLTYKSLRNFVSQLFKSCHIESLIYGNFTKKEAKKFAELVELKLKNVNKLRREKIAPLLPKISEEAVTLEPGCSYFYEINDDKNLIFGTLIFYPNEMEMKVRNVIVELFAQIIVEPIVRILRGEKELFKASETKSGINNSRFSIYLQSDKYQYYELNLENYMETMKMYIENMTNEKFNKQKELIIERMLKEPETMSEMSAIFWREISSKTYAFDRRTIEIECLNVITKQEILDFCKCS
ncbi:insulin-degrading enzyme-like isoform X2 [Leptopilina heterotoma]|uniref:insulin-degrading enzyme-like isoform X2 n=1 Tax=Leptopilina heterotoma TaxID=63436 RepID=UPI001CA92405|nr:insulin-degrading enzyme-like isoform X2 [Leptopilina heterotoma]